MHHKSTTSPLWPVFLIAILSCLAILFVTRWGIGTSPDSITYIGTARHLWTGQAELGQAALVFRPPLYPWVLAIISLIGQDPFAVARWLNAVLYAANILMVGLIVWRCQPRSPWLAICGALLMIAGMPMWEIHTYAWTEPLFIFLGFTGLYSLSVYLENEKVRWLLLSAVLFALTGLTRYAGVSFLITGGIVVLFMGSPGWGRRLRMALLFGLVAVTPVVLWMAQNAGAANMTGGRTFAFHPVGREHFWQVVFTLSDWLQLPAASPGVVRVGLMVLVGGTAVTLLIIRVIWPANSKNVDGAHIPVFYKLLLVFIPIYLLFLVVSVSFLDAATPFDNRILSPIYVACLFLSLFLLEELVTKMRHRRGIQLSIIGVLLVFLTVSFVHNGRWLLGAAQQGLGFSSLAWQQADIITQVRALPSDTLIYSNLPMAISFLADRPANLLPRKVEATTRQVNADYADELAELARHIEQQGAVIVYFYALAGNPALPTEQELINTMLLRRQVETDEGAIYVR